MLEMGTSFMNEPLFGICLFSSQTNKSCLSMLFGYLCAVQGDCTKDVCDIKRQESHPAFKADYITNQSPQTGVHINITGCLQKHGNDPNVSQHFQTFLFR